MDRRAIRYCFPHSPHSTPSCSHNHTLTRSSVSMRALSGRLSCCRSFVDKEGV